MTPLECLQYLMDNVGDCEGEGAAPELRAACAEVKSIIQLYPVFVKSQEAIISAERFVTSMYPLMWAAAAVGGNELAVSILERAKRSQGEGSGHLLSAKELNQRLIKIGKVVNGEDEYAR